MLFKDALAMAANDCLTHLGETIFINGIEVRAIFIDETFEDESGVFRRTALSIRNADAKFFKKGDRITARDRDFVITFIPQTYEPMIDIELKDA